MTAQIQNRWLKKGENLNNFELKNVFSLSTSKLPHVGTVHRLRPLCIQEIRWYCVDRGRRSKDRKIK